LLAEPAPDLSNFFHPSDEGRRRTWEVVLDTGAVDARKRPECVFQPGGAQLQHALGSLEILESVPTEVAKCDFVGKLVSEQTGRHSRDEHLTAMTEDE
jgi:hypothetical protein